MKLCPNCGNKYDDSIYDCVNCGTHLISAEPARHDNGGMMVWSVLTLFLCLIAGIVAISQTRKANAALTKVEEDAALKKAKIWNTVGCIVGVLALIGTFIQGYAG